ncbi:unnamed protein product [Notodromas monacha]|uniref:Proteasome subunit beta n=1 Tax=Notodromas monacha TaxID=399045 RepID=A0A7R9BH10_9CRUS|nr:unnamed protein product [Notodromas monacha]CAG0915315.1 unnamed protein product [Notodromas monacha]
MALAELCGVKDMSSAFTSMNLFGRDRCDESDALEDLKLHSKQLEGELNFLRTPLMSLPGTAYTKELGPDGMGRPMKMHFDHGTTTLAFLYQGGVVIAVDSRATGGSYIGSQVVEKILPINKYIVGTMAGGAADCMYWERLLSKECRMYELRNRERISVAAASKVLSNLIWNYRGQLSMGVFVAGWDKTGPALYYVDSEGQRTSGKVMSCGSGSIFAYGVLDRGYRWDLADEEAQALGRKAIYHATVRDAASGGLVRGVCVCDEQVSCDVRETEYRKKEHVIDIVPVLNFGVADVHDFVANTFLILTDEIRTP